MTAWTPQPYVELIAIYSTLALSLSKQVRVRPFVLRAYNLHCCTAQGMAPNAMEIEHEVASRRLEVLLHAGLLFFVGGYFGQCARQLFVRT